jgi:hypothetical protein
MKNTNKTKVDNFLHNGINYERLCVRLGEYFGGTFTLDLIEDGTHDLNWSLQPNNPDSLQMIRAYIAGYFSH